MLCVRIDQSDFRVGEYFDIDELPWRFGDLPRCLLERIDRVLCFPKQQERAPLHNGAIGDTPRLMF